MKCPHCAVEVHPAFLDEWLGSNVNLETGANFKTRCMRCPACDRAIIFIDVIRDRRVDRTILAYPKHSMRRQAKPEVPSELAEDFNEASTVLVDSPKASAALSRRCVQQLLRLQGYLQHDLAKQIDAVLASKTLPAALSANLDAIRNIGNFAAHPIKDTNSGVIVAVEPEEAEWNLDVLDGLFDYYYVQPAKDQARRDALNAKLVAAGKAPIKQ